jgi:hypothetical protein
MCGVLLHFLRFIRFLRGDLSEKTLHGISWLDQADAVFAQSKSSTKLPPSAPLNGITELFDQPIPTMSRESCVPWIL